MCSGILERVQSRRGEDFPAGMSPLPMPFILALVVGLCGSACGAQQSQRFQSLPGPPTPETYAKLEAGARKLGWRTAKSTDSLGNPILAVQPSPSDRIDIQNVLKEEQPGSSTLVLGNELYFNCGPAPEEICGGWVDKLVDASGLRGPGSTSSPPQ